MLMTKRNTPRTHNKLVHAATPNRDPNPNPDPNPIPTANPNANSNPNRDPNANPMPNPNPRPPYCHHRVLCCDNTGCRV